MHVAISCTTFRRAEGLERLLRGLNGLRFEKSAEPRITVLVVNNAPGDPAGRVVDAIRPGFRWQLAFAEEPEQGVSSARNRVLEMLPESADFLAFIDDDEVPVPIWLDELLHVQRVSKAPIVQGPVLPVFTDDVPAWVVRGGFFAQGPYEDGQPLHFAATNNSLIRTDVIRDLGLRFDPRFNRTGGEDQRFFGTALKAGHQVVTAGNALVHEWIPKERARVGYLLKRRFRMGNTLTMIDRIEGRPGWRIVRLGKACGRIGLGLIGAVLSLLAGRAGIVRGLTEAAWGAGAIAGLFGVAHREYDAPGTPAQLTSMPPSRVRVG